MGGEGGSLTETREPLVSRIFGLGTPGPSAPGATVPAPPLRHSRPCRAPRAACRPFSVRLAGLGEGRRRSPSRGTPGGAPACGGTRAQGPRRGPHAAGGVGTPRAGGAARRAPGKPPPPLAAAPPGAPWESGHVGRRVCISATRAALPGRGGRGGGPRALFAAGAGLRAPGEPEPPGRGAGCVGSAGRGRPASRPRPAPRRRLPGAGSRPVPSAARASPAAARRPRLRHGPPAAVRPGPAAAAAPAGGRRRRDVPGARAGAAGGGGERGAHGHGGGDSQRGPGAAHLLVQGGPPPPDLCGRGSEPGSPRSARSLGDRPAPEQVSQNSGAPEKVAAAPPGPGDTAPPPPKPPLRPETCASHPHPSPPAREGRGDWGGGSPGSELLLLHRGLQPAERG